MSGNIMYRHPSPLPNRTIRYLLLFVFFLGFMIYMFFEIQLEDGEMSGSIGELFSDPIFIGFLSAALLLITITIAVPFLFFPRRIALTKDGIFTHNNRWNTTFRNKPRFILYSRIDNIFPEFLPTFNRPDGTPEQDRLDCLKIHDIDGKDHTLPWTNYDTPFDNNAFYHMLVVLSRAPKEFKEKWSDLPFMTKQEKDLMKLMKEKGDKFILTKMDRFYLTGLIVTSSILLLGMMSIFTLITTRLDIAQYALGGLILSFFLIMPFASKLGNSKREKERIKGKIDLIEWVGDGNSFLNLCNEKDLKNVKGPVLTWDKNEANKKGNWTDLDNMIKTIDGYHPVAQVMLMLLGFILIIAGSFVLAFGGLNWITIPIGVLLIISGIGVMILIFFIWKDKDINDAKVQMEGIIAEEVKTGRNTLPEDYETPKWFKLHRGPSPLTKEELRKLEAWTRIDGKWMPRIMLTIIMGGFGIFIVICSILAFVFWIDNPFIMLPFAILPMACFGIGMYIVINRSNMDSKLARLVKWEVKSGKSILTNTLRKNHERNQENR